MQKEIEIVREEIARCRIMEDLAAPEMRQFWTERAELFERIEARLTE